MTQIDVMYYHYITLYLYLIYLPNYADNESKKRVISEHALFKRVRTIYKKA